MNIRRKITEEELEKALRSLALLIEYNEPKYWPIFDRIDAELQETRSRQQRLTTALANGQQDAK